MFSFVKSNFFIFLFDITDFFWLYFRMKILMPSLNRVFIIKAQGCDLAAAFLPWHRCHHLRGRREQSGVHHCPHAGRPVPPQAAPQYGSDEHLPFVPNEGGVAIKS